MMKWRKVQDGLRRRLAPNLFKRVDFHQARYRHTKEEIGRVWLSHDGKELVSFATQPYVRRRAEIGEALREANRLRPYGDVEMANAYSAADDVAKDILRRGGEHDDYHALEEMEAFLSMSVEDALESDSPLLRGLAMIDGRVGKRRLRELAKKPEHTLVRKLLQVRCEAEGITLGEHAV